MYRSAPFVVFLLIACAGTHTPPSARVLSPSGRSAIARAVPDSIFGVVLRKPFNSLAFNRHSCLSARDFAYRRGPYSIVTDDVLFEPPDEHEDTAAVLAALDSFAVCVGETRELNATAVVTLSDSVVGNVHIFWPDEGRAPEYEQLLKLVKEAYGEPLQNEYGVQFWSADSMDIYINHRSFYNEAPSLNLKDARVCERYERLVHRDHPKPRSGHCWVKPEPTPPEQIFSGGPIALADSDLSVAGIAYEADSSEVRRTLGPPASVDSISWVYSGLRIWFKDARVNQIHLVSPEHATRRGLRVGDRLTRATALYGPPCTPGLYSYCRTVKNEPDVRGILLENQDGIIKGIVVGAIFAPD